MKLVRGYKVMKPVFLKIDKIKKEGDYLVLSFPPGGIQLEHNDEILLMNESLEITVDSDLEFRGILQKVEFLLYDDNSIEARPWVLKRTVGEIISYDGFEEMVAKEIKKLEDEEK